MHQLQHAVLSEAILELAGRPLREQEIERLLGDLREGWGNRVWSARVDYLRACLSAALRAEGPILECGSGLTTLVLGIAARQTGGRVISLEHDPHWAETTMNCLRRYGLVNGSVIHTPLRDYGGYHWYDISAKDFPGDFSLVICDGPPGTTRGGRYGLLPVMHQYLLPDCIILLDDTERPGEQEVLARWRQEFGFSVESCAPDAHFCRISHARKVTKALVDI